MIITTSFFEEFHNKLDCDNMETNQKMTWGTDWVRQWNVTKASREFWIMFIYILVFIVRIVVSVIASSRAKLIRSRGFVLRLNWVIWSWIELFTRSLAGVTWSSYWSCSHRYLTEKVEYSWTGLRFGQALELTHNYLIYLFVSRTFVVVF